MDFRLDTYRLQDGRTVHIGSDGYEYEPLEQGMAGLFSKDGFFSKVVNTASGIFKKKDGTPTFIGQQVSNFSTAFGERLGTQVAQQGQLQNGVFLPQGPLATTTSTLPAPGGNPLPKKDNTALYWGLGLGIPAAVATAIYLYKQSQKSQQSSGS